MSKKSDNYWLVNIQQRLYIVATVVVVLVYDVDDIWASLTVEASYCSAEQVEVTGCTNGILQDKFWIEV